MHHCFLALLLVNTGHVVSAVVSKVVGNGRLEKVGWDSVCALKYALHKCAECGDKNNENGGEFKLDLLVSLTFSLT